jgi:hypothetical protein
MVIDCTTLYKKTKKTSTLGTASLAQLPSLELSIAISDTREFASQRYDLAVDAVKTTLSAAGKQAPVVSSVKGRYHQLISRC